MKIPHKQFNAFDQVLIRDANDIWQIDFYSHWNNDYNQHVTLAYGDGIKMADSDILPYEGNEKLLGTTDEPEEEITIENGEFCFGANKGAMKQVVFWQLFQFDCVDDSDDTFKERFGQGRYFDFAIRFSDFNPNDLDVTRMNILCVRNGRIVRYKKGDV